MSGKREGKRVEEKKGGEFAVVTVLIRGSLTGLVILLLFLLAGTGGISLGILGQEMMERWGILSCIVGSLLGGWISVRQDRCWALVLGPGTGGILFTLLLMMGLIFYGELPSGDKLIPVLCACLCGGGMAGILGRKRKKKKRR